jgi:signal transduction histidine kinase
VHRIRTWAGRHALLLDVAAGVALFVASMVWTAGRLDAHRVLLETTVAAALCAPLALRRRHPVGVFAVISAVALAQWLLNVEPRPADLAILIALYTVAAHAPRRVAVIATGVVIAGVIMATARWNFDGFFAALITPLAFALIALTLGDDLQTRRANVAELQARAEQLERERETVARIAVAAERTNIARELHDVVAHNLSVMVVQADAATYAIDRDPSQARDAMNAVASTGRQALTEMRQLLDVLRPTTGELAPQPGIEQLGELVAGVRLAGLPVELELPEPPPPLPAGVSLTVYRIIQEALTNTIKHAGPAARSRVVVRMDDRDLTILVEDTGGRGRDDQAEQGHVGQGLVGMRERVAMYGGSVAAGQSASHGFTVNARLPARALG